MSGAVDISPHVPSACKRVDVPVVVEAVQKILELEKGIQVLAVNP
jgi:hypothetical protein